MEKLTLLEKMRTLNRWQTQQQINFAKLQSDIESYTIQSDSNDSPKGDNKENEDLNGSVFYPTRPFMQTMGRNTLTSALESIKNPIGEEQEEEEQDLNNWYLSGLQTVKFMSHSDSEGENAVISQNTENSNHVDNTDTEDFSDGEILNFDSEDGVQPLSETEDEYDDQQIITFHDQKQFEDIHVSESEEINHHPNQQLLSESCQESEEDEKENTILHSGDNDKINIDEKPVFSKLNKPGLTFERMIEEEMNNHVENELNTSTPMKKKKHNFLKRGEGLKRFERGKNYHIPKKDNPNRKKESSAGISSKPSTAFSIKPLSPSAQEFKQPKSKNKPGLPLKLNLKRSKQGNGRTDQHAQTGDSQIVDTKFSDSTSNGMNGVYFDPTTHDKLEKQPIVSASILEASFQKMISQYKEKEERENKEVDDFEALEEAAENMSLSSNSSLVVKLLGKKKRNEGVQQLDGIIEKQSPNTESPMKEIPDERKSRTPSYDFEDETSWSDHTHSDTSIFSVEENENTIIHDTSPSPPLSPTELPPMKRIISKKRDLVRTNVNGTHEEAGSADKSYVPPPSTISLTVQKKLAELENEIKTFRAENDKLENLRRERENEVSKLRREIQTFQSERKAETERFETYKTEELKKLKAEKKAFDKYQKAARAYPNKQEREEMKEMKQEMERLKDDLKTRETRWNNASHRFRTRINELEGENQELRQEIKIFEEERLDRWKKGYTKTNRIRGKVYTDILSYDDGKVQEPMEQISKGFSGILESKKRSLSPRSPPQRPTHSDEFASSPDQMQLRSPGDGAFKSKDGKTEIILPDKSKLITFPNGTKKTISPDGKVVSVCFFNGDIKRSLPDNRVVYYYAKTQTTHTTYEDGLEVLEFSNKQIEKRHPDGRTEVIFPDQTIKYLYPDGREETVFTDGTIQTINTDGVRTIVFPNGQRETHTRDFKRREYPNGTVKTVYEDGRQETRYSNGRLRVKDKHGNLVMDSGLNSS